MSAGPNPRPAIQRLLARIERTEGCWIWPGATNHRGYGSMGGDDGKTASTHRVAYEGLVGPIPDGLHLDHLCRVRLCCNPDHLEPVTNAENRHRSVGLIQAERPLCPKGHAYSEENTYIAPTGDRHCRTCSNARTRAYKARKRQEMSSV